MDYIGFLLEIPQNYRFHTFFGDFTLFSQLFFNFFFIISSDYSIATRIYMDYIGFLVEIPKN